MDNNDEAGNSQATEDTTDANVSQVNDKSSSEDATSDQISDDSGQDKGSVPYSRFEEVVRANQEFRTTFSKQLEEITDKLSQITGQQNQVTNGPTKKTWDDRAKEARNWDEFVGSLKEDIFSDLERKETEKKEQAEKALDAELKGLYNNGLITTKSEENELLDFAIKQSEKVGKAIPLSIAYYWWKETKPKTGNENNEASKNIQSSKKSSGGPGKSKSDYKQTHSRDLDDIVLEAKENAPKEA